MRTRHNVSLYHTTLFYLSESRLERRARAHTQDTVELVQHQTGSGMQADSVGNSIFFFSFASDEPPSQMM